MTKTQTTAPEPGETTGALIPIETINLPQLFAKGVGLDAFLAEMRKRTADIVPDTSTEAGRKEIKSLAYRVSRTKTTIDDAGKEFTEEMRADLKRIDANRAKIRTELDALRDEVRKPVDEWEAAEEARQQAELDAARAEAEEREREEERARDIQIQISALAATPAGFVGLELDRAEALYATLRDRQLTADDFGDRLSEAESIRATALGKIDGLLQMQRKMAQLEAEAEAGRRAEEERRKQEDLRIAAEKQAALEAEAERQRAAAAEQQRAHEVQMSITGIQTRYLLSGSNASASRLADLIAELEAEIATITPAEYDDRVADAKESASVTLYKLREMHAERSAAEVAEANAARMLQEQVAREQAEAERIKAEAEEAAKREKEAAKASHRKRIRAEAEAGMKELINVTAAQAKALVAAIESGAIPHTTIEF